ncbi:hypothetical protein [Pontimicrobium sp. IMCC45349]|uniref:hypothetical protein n=1 Tax=Pontimicrobium sp. IMCC45349 TaxID=3391574 RepID=UPI0039A3E7A3
MIFSRSSISNWSLLKKISFRFIFSYFILYNITSFASTLGSSLIFWVGKHILRIDYEFSAIGYGSGDTTYQYIQIFVFVVTALISTFIWSILDYKRPSYNKVAYFFQLILRFVLIYYLLVYGFIKVFYLQFSPPSLNRLLQPAGDMSPMGLAWTFMGYSKAYCIFSGLLEVIGGYLLVSKRTQTLGSIIIIAVMANVFMMNMCFDIPVKLFSFHLLAMALILCFTDYKKLINIFILNKDTKKTDFYSPYTFKNQMEINVIRGIKLFLITGVSIVFISMGYSRSKNYGVNRVKPELYGIWETSYFIKNNDTIPALVDDNNRWEYLIIDYKDRATIKTMTGNNKRYSFITDSTFNKISMFKDTDTIIHNFSYKKHNEHFLELNGQLDSDNLKIILTKKDLDDFRLTKRGFNWINEKPYNR